MGGRPFNGLNIYQISGKSFKRHELICSDIGYFDFKIKKNTIYVSQSISDRFTTDVRTKKYSYKWNGNHFVKSKVAISSESGDVYEKLKLAYKSKDRKKLFEYTKYFIDSNTHGTPGITLSVFEDFGRLANYQVRRSLDLNKKSLQKQAIDEINELI